MSVAAAPSINRGFNTRRLRGGGVPVYTRVAHLARKIPATGGQVQAQSRYLTAANRVQRHSRANAAVKPARRSGGAGNRRRAGQRHTRVGHSGAQTVENQQLAGAWGQPRVPSAAAAASVRFDIPGPPDHFCCVFDTTCRIPPKKTDSATSPLNKGHSAANIYCNIERWYKSRLALCFICNVCL